MQGDSSSSGGSGILTPAASRWSLRGTTALVTGGTRGIGYAIAEDLAKLGAAVHTCSRNEAELKERLKKWEELGLRVTGSVCDCSLPEQREELMRTVAATFGGKLNILINNVGTNIMKKTLEYTLEEYTFLMRTNLESSYHLCQLAHHFLKASDRGSIVFVSSIAGLTALSVGTVYAATKGAINQVTKELACEWAKDNIRTNTVAPWLIRTQLVQMCKFATAYRASEF